MATGQWEQARGGSRNRNVSVTTLNSELDCGDPRRL